MERGRSQYQDDPRRRSFQQNYKQLLDEVSVISKITKVEVGVISLSR